MFINIGTIVFDESKNRYTVDEVLGNGAFGLVYKIVREKDKENFALKTLINFSSEESYKAFLNESELALNVNHENVLQYIYIHDGKTFDGLPPYIIMEYANEGNLNDMLKNYSFAKQFIDTEILKSYYFQLINGMQAINNILIHRDIKPDNILIKNSVLKISDFGLSKIVEEQTRTMTFKGIGHIMFMSPEGWKNEKNSIQMDIYSMGIVFYMLATLQHPFKIKNETNIEEWKDAHLFQSPLRPESINPAITPILSQIILKMLEKSKSKRYTSWVDIKNDFDKQQFISNPYNELVNSILSERLKKDNEILQKNLEHQRKLKEIEDYNKLIYHQFIDKIINPIKELIEAINLQYTSGKIHFDIPNSPSGHLKSEITLVSMRKITIQLKSLRDEDFYRDINYNWGRSRELRRPIIHDRLILAWGYVKTYENIGYNIILVQNKEDMYGEWVLLINKNNPMVVNQRYPEPFPFEFNELEKEISVLGAAHIYMTQIIPFNLDEIAELIKHFN